VNPSSHVDPEARKPPKFQLPHFADVSDAWHLPKPLDIFHDAVWRLSLNFRGAIQIQGDSRLFEARSQKNTNASFLDNGQSKGSLALREFGDSQGILLHEIQKYRPNAIRKSHGR
jgi:hypothetical protein